VNETQSINTKHAVRHKQEQFST